MGADQKTIYAHTHALPYTTSSRRAPPHGGRGGSLVGAAVRERLLLEGRGNTEHHSRGRRVSYRGSRDPNRCATDARVVSMRPTSTPTAPTITFRRSTDPRMPFGRSSSCQKSPKTPPGSQATPRSLTIQMTGTRSISGKARPSNKRASRDSTFMSLPQPVRRGTLARRSSGSPAAMGGVGFDMGSHVVMGLGTDRVLYHIDSLGQATTVGISTLPRTSSRKSRSRPEGRGPRCSDPVRTRGGSGHAKQCLWRRPMRRH